jgi:hypothetical protein
MVVLAAIRARSLFCATALIPAVVVLGCCYPFYAAADHPKSVKKIRNISELVDSFPRNRIFAVVINVMAAFLAICLYIRDRWVGRGVHWVAIIGLPILYSVVADVTLREGNFIHLVPALAAFVGSHAYFGYTDTQAAAAAHRITFFSRMLPVVGILCFTVFIQTIPRWRSPFIYSAGSVLEFILAGTIFAKLAWTAREMEGDWTITFELDQPEAKEKNE